MQWIVTGGALVAGFVLGWIGLDQHASADGVSLSVWDLAYEDLHLLTFGGAPSSPPSLPWQLQVARFLLPLALAYGALAALLTLFRDRAQLLRLPFLRDHVIVAGLGTKGITLVEALRAEGTRVVAIELDPVSPALAQARQAGATVIIGDATDGGVIRLAGIARARSLIAAANDTTNAEVALRARDLHWNRRRAPLHCLAHVVDPDLATLLRRDTFGSDQGADGIDIDFFSVHDVAARQLLSRFAAADERVVVVGLGPVAQRLLLRAAGRPSGEPSSCSVVLVETGASEALVRLRARHPWLGDCVTAVACSVDAPDLGDRIVLAAEAAPATVFVCLSDANETLEAALRLRGALQGCRSNLIAVLSRPGSLTRLIDESDDAGGRSTLRAVSLQEIACTKELATGGMVEQLARLIHDNYVAAQLAKGVDSSDPALQDWNDPRTLRDSNRAQALDIKKKLREARCVLVPADDPRGSGFTFSDDEINVLAEREHERWMEERLRAGWVLGPERDTKNRVSPSLVAWNDLSPAEQEKDREAVQAIPSLMAQAGFDILRLAPNDLE